MTFVEGNIYHIYNRGNQQQRIFFRRENYLFFLNKMRKNILPYGQFIAYCLMPNHFHWMVRVRTTKEIEHFKEKVLQPNQSAIKKEMEEMFSDNSVKKNLNNAIGVTLRSYTRAIQFQESLTGSLFQQKTKAKEVYSFSDASISSPGNFHDDFLSCFQYIHQSPRKAGLVKRLEEWEFSSFIDYAGFRNGTLCDQRLGLQLLGIKNKNEFLKITYEAVDEELIRRFL